MLTLVVLLSGVMQQVAAQASAMEPTQAFQAKLPNTDFVEPGIEVQSTNQTLAPAGPSVNGFLAYNVTTALDNCTAIDSLSVASAIQQVSQQPDVDKYINEALASKAFSIELKPGDNFKERGGQYTAKTNTVELQCDDPELTPILPETIEHEFWHVNTSLVHSGKVCHPDRRINFSDAFPMMYKLNNPSLGLAQVQELQKVFADGIKKIEALHQNAQKVANLPSEVVEAIKMIQPMRYRLEMTGKYLATLKKRSELLPTPASPSRDMSRMGKGPKLLLIRHSIEVPYYPKTLSLRDNRHYMFNSFTSAPGKKRLEEFLYNSLFQCHSTQDSVSSKYVESVPQLRRLPAPQKMLLRQLFGLTEFDAFVRTLPSEVIEHFYPTWKAFHERDRVESDRPNGCGKS